MPTTKTQTLSTSAQYLGRYFWSLPELALGHYMKTFFKAL